MHIRTALMAAVLTLLAGTAIAQDTTQPTQPAPAPSPRPHAVDMTTCRDGTKVMIAVRDRFCATHGGVGPPATAAPSGATVKCNDGSYSFSQHHDDACSHHGGVAAWLSNLPGSAN